MKHLLIALFALLPVSALAQDESLGLITQHETTIGDITAVDGDILALEDQIRELEDTKKTLRAMADDIAAETVEVMAAEGTNGCFALFAPVQGQPLLKRYTAAFNRSVFNFYLVPYSDKVIEKTEQGVAISQKDRGFTVTQHLFDITGEDAADMLALCE